MPTLQNPKDKSHRVEVGDGDDQKHRLSILQSRGWTVTEAPASVTLADTAAPVPAWDQTEGDTPESIEAETGTPAEAVTEVPAEDAEPKGKAKK